MLRFRTLYLLRGWLKLTTAGDKSMLQLTHQAIGLITPEHLEGVRMGWEHELKKIREAAERRAGESRKR